LSRRQSGRLLPGEAGQGRTRTPSRLSNGFSPQAGDEFQPLLFAQGRGAFARYTGDVGGFSFLYVYEDGDSLPPGLTLADN
jgi:hypothetical protein